MPCSKESITRLFYNALSSILLLLIFLYSSITSLLKHLNVIGSYPIIQRNQDHFEYYICSEEEEEEEMENNNYFHGESPAESEEEVENNDYFHGESPAESEKEVENNYYFHGKSAAESEEEVENNDYFHGESRAESEAFLSNNNHLQRNYDFCEELPETLHDPVTKEIPKRDANSLHNFVQNQGCTTLPSSTDHQHQSGFVDNDKNCDDYSDNPNFEKTKLDSIFSVDGDFLVYEPTQLESKELKDIEKDDEEIFGDSCTNESTSKSSSEWRSSINCRDLGTEDPFSFSERRSCPTGESYTVFQKYDEEMTFLDRISAQKLHETESLRSIKVCPRSVSERIIHQFSTINKTRPLDIGRNPYHELEAAYVAQICLTWEALNWNYTNFQRKRAARRGDFDPGCPAGIAQQFQQFQVLLQRYIENEPYEHGSRPEVYARMRLLAPKLLLVPEYHDSEEDEGFGSRISTSSFLMIMEDGIRTFMSFLKADKEKPCQILKALFSRNRSDSVDPILLQMMKNVNNKKKMKLKDLRRARKCVRKRKLTVDEEMEILMGLIDLRVVSRVLRMSDLSEEQMHWCEEKMSKVRVLDGKLQRDSSTLFFPSH